MRSTGCIPVGSRRFWTDLQFDVSPRFPVSAVRAKNAIAGISMGGYGAMKLALKYPEKFSFAGSLSGPFDITRRALSFRRLGQSLSIALIFGFDPAQRKQEDVFELLHKSKRTDIFWFVACGRKDPLFPINRRFADSLLQRQDIVEVPSQRSGHDWQSWNEVMPRLVDEVKNKLNSSTVVALPSSR